MKSVMALAALLIAVPLAQAEAAQRPGSAPSSAAKVVKCKKGEIYNKIKKACVKVESGIVPDDELYWQGRALARAGQFDWAIEVLSAVKDKNDPEVLNFLGYSHRKAGRLDRGIGYYRKALAIDPDYVLVREYLGEGYVAAGKLGLARAQLAEIAKRCGATCEEYQDLASAIAKASP